MKITLLSAESNHNQTNTNNNINNLDLIITSLTESLNKYKEKLILKKEFLREFLESIASWILKNFSSSKLNNLLNLVILFFNSMNYRIEIQKEG